MGTHTRREREDALYELENRFCEHAKDGELGKLAQADIAMIIYRLGLGVGLEEKVRQQKNDLARLGKQLDEVQAQSSERLAAIREAARIFDGLDTDGIPSVQRWLALPVVKGALER